MGRFPEVLRDLLRVPRVQMPRCTGLLLKNPPCVSLEKCPSVSAQRQCAITFHYCSRWISIFVVRKEDIWTINLPSRGQTKPITCLGNEPFPQVKQRQGQDSPPSNDGACPQALWIIFFCVFIFTVLSQCVLVLTRWLGIGVYTHKDLNVHVLECYPTGLPSIRHQQHLTGSDSQGPYSAKPNPTSVCSQDKCQWGRWKDSASLWPQALNCSRPLPEG